MGRPDCPAIKKDSDQAVILLEYGYLP